MLQKILLNDALLYGRAVLDIANSIGGLHIDEEFNVIVLARDIEIVISIYYDKMVRLGGKTLMRFEEMKPT